MIGNPDRVVGGDGFDDSKNGWVIEVFFDESAEDFIPDDEDACIIPIEISGVCGVMNPVMAWCVHNRFKP